MHGNHERMCLGSLALVCPKCVPSHHIMPSFYPPPPLDILNWHLSKQSVGCEVALEFSEALRKELKVCLVGNWMSNIRL